MPDTAVVILNWNGKHYLQQFLPSVCRNTSHERAIIVVADNGSDDDSLPYVQSNFPEVRIIRLNKNYGFADGYNRALKQLSGYAYFVLLNSDIEVPPGWLEPLLRVLDEQKGVAACMPKIHAYAKKEMFEYAGAAGGFIDRYGYPFCRGRIFDVLEKDEGQYDNPTDIFWATGACMCIRSEAFFRADGFDPVFFAHQEEIDLCWRLKNSGARILYIPQSVVYHVGGGTLPKENPQKTFLNFRNNLILLYKNLPRDKVFPILFIRLALDCISAIRFLLRGDYGNFRAIWKSHNDFFVQLKKYRASGAEFLQLNVRRKHSEVYRKSIVWDFFIRKRKTFGELDFKL